jgi:hypothetical protein
MSEVQSSPRVGKPKSVRPVSHYMSVTDAVEVLRARHGPDGARKVIREGLRRAKCARSRKRFEFWTAVCASIDG